MVHTLGETIVCTACGLDSARWSLIRNQCRDCHNRKHNEYDHKNKGIREAIRAKTREKSKAIIESGINIQCTRCGETKPSKRFIPGSKVCKDCNNVRSKEKRDQEPKCQGFRSDGSNCTFRAAYEYNEQKYCKVHFGKIKDGHIELKPIEKRTCKYVFKVGESTGKTCIRKATTEDGYCGTHSSYLAKLKNIENIGKTVKKNVDVKTTKPEPEVELRLSIKDSTLTMNTIVIEAREHDGKINLTQMCRAGNKKFNDWQRNKKTQSFLQILSPSTGYPVSELLTYEDFGRENRATWGHPQVAINLAQWISPEFDVRVSKWIYELALTGKVALGQEKPQEELDGVWKEKCEKLTIEKEELGETNQKLILQNTELSKKNKKLIVTVNKYIKRHHYIKLDFDGPCYYVYTVKCEIENCTGKKIRPGIAGTGGNSKIDDRLKTHRGDDPNMVLELVIMSSGEKIELLEKVMLSKYRENLIAPNHEVVSTEQDVKNFKDSALMLIKNICCGEDEYKVLSDEKVEEYNKKVQDTLLKPIRSAPSEASDTKPKE
jgi:hypothetical protein